jgi:hypothetical protein
MKTLMTMMTMMTFLASTAAFATPIPGGPLTHGFSCKANELGVGYSLEVTTQALNPAYDIRNIKLFSRVVYPNAPLNEIPMREESQDINEAVWSGDNFAVRLDKATFEAKVYEDGHLLATCNEVTEQ